MLAACWSEAAFAQSSPLRNLDLFVGNVLTYDDNVFRTPDDGVARPGTEAHDWIIEPTVSAVYTRPLARGNLSLRGALSYKFYRENSELNRENIDFGADADTQLLRCDVNGNVSFRRAQSDLADILDGATVKNVENRTSFGAGVLCGSNLGIRPGFEYAHEQVTNGSDIREFSNYRTDSYTARIGYSRPTLGFISIYGTIEDGSYPNRPSPGAGLPANDEVRTYSGGLSYSREIGARLSGSVSVGYMRVKPKLAGVPGHKGITYQGSLSYKGSDRISGSLNFSRGTQQSNLLGVDYSISTQISANVSYAISRIISLSGNAAYIRRNFQSSVFATIPTAGKDSTKQFGLAATFKSFRKISITLAGQHIERSSDDGLLDYSANRVSLTTGLQF
jgi:hypothetical protein